MNNSTELRKVPAAILDRLAVILDIDEDWKRVLRIIPADLRSPRFIPKYTIEHVGMIEQYAKDKQLKGARVLFDEWGTSGQVRPTLQTLKDVLAQAQMIRAADELALLLNEKLPPRPSDGPGAEVNLNVTSILNNTSAIQNANTRKLSDNCNGIVNASFEANCNDSTMRMESAPNLIQFSKTEEHLPNFAAMAHHTTDMIRNKNNLQSASDLIAFSKDQCAQIDSSSQYMPRLSVLLPEKENNSSFSNISAASIGNSETSQSASEVSSHLQSSNMQMESLTASTMYNQVDNEILQDINLVQFKYAELKAIARNFVPDSDSQVGSGGFGDVFKGAHEKYGLLAIKKAHNLQPASADIVKIFNTEVKCLSILRHTNVVPILGFSLDGPTPCIVCRYIDGGSLMFNIQEKRLNENQRMNIINGTAEGLKYIHNTVKPSLEPQSSSKKAYFLHGDVKSANILLTNDGIPMLCDFGLSKQYTTTHHTQSIIGTQAYMAPERFKGTITQKGDIYSLGVVLLELLTGEEPIITKHNESINIINYVEDSCIDGNITTVLDPMVMGWSKAHKIYDLAKMCLSLRREKRPTMNQVCEILQEIDESEG